jgi:hypothetical protein
MVATAWTVTRTQHRVRVDIMEASRFEDADTEAIAVALEEYLDDDTVTVIQLDGPALRVAVLMDGLGPAIKHLGNRPAAGASNSTLARSSAKPASVSTNCP